MDNIILSNVSLDELANCVAEKINSLQKNNNHQELIKEKEYLTPDDACEFIQLAKPTLYTLTSKNLIPFIKKGKKLYFKRSDLIEWLNSGKRCTRQEIEAGASSHFLRNQK